MLHAKEVGRAYVAEGEPPKLVDPCPRPAGGNRRNDGYMLGDQLMVVKRHFQADIGSINDSIGNVEGVGIARAFLPGQCV